MSFRCKHFERRRNIHLDCYGLIPQEPSYHPASRLQEQAKNEGTIFSVCLRNLKLSNTEGYLCSGGLSVSQPVRQAGRKPMAVNYTKPPPRQSFRHRLSILPFIHGRGAVLFLIGQARNDTKQRKI